MTMLEITDDNFDEEVLKSDEPVLIDFWAEWCGPCKAFLPTLEEYAGEQGGKVKVGKVNVENSPNVPTQYGVRAVPTLIVFKGGEVVAQRAGALAKNELEKWVNDAI